MNIFESIDSALDDIFKFIVEEDDIKRLLGNNSKNALTESVPNKDWFKDYLFDSFRVPDVTSEIKTFIMIEMSSTDKSGSNLYQFDAEIVIDVICHEDVIRLSNGRRLLKILALIDSRMKDVHTKSIKGKFTFSSPCRKIIYSNEFQGYRLSYSISNTSVNCG